MQNLEKKLIEILNLNPYLSKALDILKKYKIKNYYIWAWIISQTVWNHKYWKDIIHGISDMDIVYYDADDTSYEAENKIIKEIKNLLKDIPIKLDIKNQARVHLRYKSVYWSDVMQYISLEHAISTRPTTVTCTAIRKESGKSYKVYAPFWLADLFNWTLRPNKPMTTQEIYQKKVNKRIIRRPELQVIPR